MGVGIYREPRMVASNENSAMSNEFVSSVGGKSTTGLRREKERDEDREAEQCVCSRTRGFTVERETERTDEASNEAGRRVGRRERTGERWSKKEKEGRGEGDGEGERQEA